MGYDVYSRLGDAKRAMDFARKYEYNWMFDKESNFKGDERVYYRVNIWGMGTIRQYLAEVASAQNQMEELDPILKKFSWNDGDWVTIQECTFLADLIEFSPQDVKDLAAEAVAEDGDTEGLNKGLAEFVEYLRICAELEGCEVY